MKHQGKVRNWMWISLVICMAILLTVVLCVEKRVLDARIGIMISYVDVIMWALTVCMIGTYLDNVEKEGLK